MKQLIVLIVLLVTCINANGEYMGLDAIIATQVSYFNSSGVDQPVPEGWESNFQPIGGNMSLDKSAYGMELSLSLGLQPFWHAKTIGWTIGMPVVYTIPLFDSGEESLDFKTTVGATTVDWWDEVSLLEVQMKRKFPAIGIAFRKHDSRWGFQYLVQPYDLSLVEFKGIDRVNNRNSSKPTRKDSIENGLGHIIEISFLTDIGYSDKITMRYDWYGSDVWGMSIGYTFFSNLLNPNTTK
jgi:hypothetical protein